MRLQVQYNRIPKKRPIGAVIAAGICIGISGWIITKTAPGKWWVEALVLALTGGAIFLLGSWFSGKKRWGLFAVVAILGLLICKRLEILGGLTIGIGLVVLGLISLAN